jgi:hypothetical protein
VHVRDRSSKELHAILMKFQRQLWEEGDLTDGQHRYFDQAVAELVWRSARKRRNYRRCWCEFCFTEFELRDEAWGDPA